LHDGYYTRVGIGTEYLGLFGSGPSGSASISGQAFRVDVAFGGTPWPGLVLGGVLSVSQITASFDGAPPGATGSAELALPFFGLLVDWFPAPRGVWHVGASIGPGGYIATDYSHRSYRAIAPEASFFGGFDGWIGSQYSVGLALVTHVATPAAADDGDGAATGYRFTPFSLGIQSSLLYH
jgi:hypothetical protein